MDGGSAPPFDDASPLPSAPSAEELSRFALNDFGNAMRLIRLAGGEIDARGRVDVRSVRLLYLREHGWIGFDEDLGHWDLRGGEGLAQKLAHEVAKGLPAQADLWAAATRERLEAQGEKVTAKTLAEFYDFAESCGNAGRTSAMLRQAQTYLQVDLDAFDRHPLWLNCRNGTLKFERIRDLAGGRYDCKVRFQRRHDPGDRLTRRLEVDYDPEAAAPMFETALKQWQPAPAMRLYLQTLIGYCFSADTSEQLFVIFQGKGRDGKSTFMVTLRKLGGSYAATADVKSFLDIGQRSGSDASPDIARLAGDTRLISTAEPPKNARLADDMIKKFTGGGAVTARHLKQGIFEFEPVGKVVMECNGRPQPQGGDEGIWRRLKLVLWENQIAKGSEDKELPAKLDAERAGILNWVALGVKRWICEGLTEPARVLEALDDYRRGSSPFSEWCAEHLVLDKGSEAGASDLYKSYKAFVEERDEKPMSQTSFGKALGELQVLRGRDSVGRVVRKGARLKTEAEREADRAAQAEAGAGGSSSEPNFEADDSDGFDL